MGWRSRSAPEAVQRRGDRRRTHRTAITVLRRSIFCFLWPNARLPKSTSGAKWSCRHGVMRGSPMLLGARNQREGPGVHMRRFCLFVAMCVSTLSRASEVQRKAHSPRPGGQCWRPTLAVNAGNNSGGQLWRPFSVVLPRAIRTVLACVRQLVTFLTSSSKLWKCKERALGTASS